MTSKTKNIGIFIFDDAEVLDFAGPFEVFSVTSQLNDYKPFNVFTIAASDKTVRAVNGLQVKPDFTFSNHPAIDILIVAGGQGTRNLIDNQEVLEWVKQTYIRSETTLSICSGARIFGMLGTLSGHPFCTHKGVYEHMSVIAPTAIPCPDKRFVQSTPKLYTSGGISAGIDLSFHIVETLLGQDTCRATAEYMEYELRH